MNVHVVPTNDQVEHQLSDACICGPRQEACQNGWVVVHNSLDGREEQERSDALHNVLLGAASELAEHDQQLRADEAEFLADRLSHTSCPEWVIGDLLTRARNLRSAAALATPVEQIVEQGKRLREALAQPGAAEKLGVSPSELPAAVEQETP